MKTEVYTQECSNHVEAGKECTNFQTVTNTWATGERTSFRAKVSTNTQTGTNTKVSSKGV